MQTDSAARLLPPYPKNMAKCLLRRSRTSFSTILVCAALLIPGLSWAVELDGFALGAPKGEILSRLAEVGSAEELVGCFRPRPAERTEYCNAYGASERFAVLGLPLEDAFIEFWLGTTSSIEFHLRVRGNREQVYATALRVLTERFSTPTKSLRSGVWWEGEGWVVMLNKVKGGGVALLLMMMNTQSPVALLRGDFSENQM